jgi:hypothetical protein
MLLEAMLAVYMSLLIYGLTVYDANLLYSLVGHPFTADLWHRFFGGFMAVADNTGNFIPSCSYHYNLIFGYRQCY